MKNYSNLEKAFPGLSKEYTFAKLEEKDAAKNPFDQFVRWLTEAVKAGVPKPNAMTVASVSPKGIPSARIVFLKGFSEKGFVFFTHYTSPKGKDFAVNPHAALVFFWPQQERQVRITGKVVQTTRQESIEYFCGRSRDSQLATLVSTQSRLIKGRKTLEEKLQALGQKWNGRDILCPESWGGYCVIPSAFEFWQGREYRLNDRLLYRKLRRGWMIQRLQP